MNKHKKKLLCIISFAVVVSISFVYTKSVRADENFRVAKIKSFSGKVKIGKGGGEKTFDAIEGMSLVEGDSITTEKDSSALLYIDDDKEVKIGDNSIVNLSELSGYIDSDDQKTGISLWVGKIFSNIKKKLKIRSKYEIKVPTAVMGVRGTEFSVESLADGDIKVIVLEGTVTAVRTVVNDSEKYTTFEITITKDQSVSMNQNDQAQSDVTITGIKVNEASQFVLEILKDFIERNPESLDENAKKEIYDEIDKRIAEKSAMEGSSNDDSEIEKPSIKIDPIVEENMSLNNVMTLADSENQNMQPPDLQPEGVQDNQLVQTTVNAVAGQETLSTQQGLPQQMPEQVAPQQITGEPNPEQTPVQQIPPQPKPEPEPVPVQPIAEETKPAPVDGGTTHSSTDTPVTSVNSAPSVQNSSVETSYSTMVSGIIAASDVNGDTLSYSLRTPAENGTAVLNSETGAWEYTPAQQFTGTDSFVVTVSDGKGGIVMSTITVTVMPQVLPPVNTAPTAQNRSETIFQGTSMYGLLIVTDSDINTVLTYTVTSQPTNGVVQVNSNGSYIYTPNANYSGIDSFKFKANDGTADSNEATVSIAVMPVNNVPIVLQNYSIETQYNTKASGTISAYDVDGDTLVYTVTTAASAVYGTATVDSTTGAWEYTPAQSFSGTDSFVITVSDGKGGIAASIVTVTVGNAPNIAPTASDDTVTTDYNTAKTGTISAMDANNDTLSYSVTAGAGHGTATVDSSTGTWTYTPATGFSGSDSFVVTVNDGHGGTVTSTISVTVGNAPNVAPTASDDTVTTDYNTAKTGTISATDANNDTLSYAVTTGAGHGTATVDSSTGAWTYTPVTGFSGSDSFVVTVNDGRGGTVTSTISVTVGNAPNVAPTASDDTVTTDYNTAKTGTISATDANNDTLSYAVTTGAGHGTATVDSTTGAWTYTPATGFSGSDSFVVTVNDGHGGTVTSTISVTVGNAPNVAPTASDDTVTTDYNTAKTGTISATDANNDTLSYAVTTGAGHGTAAVDSTTGAWTYTPATGFSGSDSFVVTVNDGHGGTVTSTISVTVGNAPNVAPTASDDTVTTDYNTAKTGTISATDGNNDTLSYAVTTGAGHGTAAVDSTTGAWTYTPATGFSGSDSFVVTVNDGHGGTVTSTISVTVGNAPNIAPTAQDGSITTSEDTTATGQLTAVDVDANTTLTYIVTSNPAHGIVTLNGNGSYSYIPNADYNGSDSFKFKVNDGMVDSSEATVSITVTPVNDVPTADDGSLTASVDTTETGQLTAVDVDANTTLTYIVISNPAHGTVTLNGNGSYTYTPEVNYYGIDSFKFKVNDGTVDSNEATVSIKVMAASSLNLQNQTQNGNLYFDDTPRLFFDDDIVVPTDLNQILITDANSNVVPITEASVIDVSILKLYCPSMQSGQYTISIPSGVISNTTGTRYNGIINLPFIVDLQGLKSFLSSEIADAQNLASTTTIGSTPGQCSDQLAMAELNVAITNAQNIINKTDSTIDEINVAINTLQSAVKQVKNNIVNTLNVTTPAAVSVSDNFDAVIEVQPGIGNFSSGLSSSNITLGGSFAGLNIKSVSVGQNLSLAQIELSGILSSSGIGTITINADGLENPISLKDITASITVNP